MSQFREIRAYWGFTGPIIPTIVGRGLEPVAIVSFEEVPFECLVKGSTIVGSGFSWVDLTIDRFGCYSACEAEGAGYE
jgi:hypothetical protein